MSLNPIKEPAKNGNMRILAALFLLSLSACNSLDRFTGGGSEEHHTPDVGSQPTGVYGVWAGDATIDGTPKKFHWNLVTDNGANVGHWVMNWGEHRGNVTWSQAGDVVTVRLYRGVQGPITVTGTLTPDNKLDLNFAGTILGYLTVVSGTGTLTR